MKSIMLALTVLVSGCLSAEVDLPSACATRTVSFPGAVASGVTLPSVTQSYSFDTGVGTEWLTKVQFLSGALTLAAGGSFAFVDELMVSVASPTGGDELVLWDAQKPATDTATLNVVGSDKNLVDYIGDDHTMILNLTVATQAPPATTWGIDANLCLSAQVYKKYGL